MKKTFIILILTIFFNFENLHASEREKNLNELFDNEKGVLVMAENSEIRNNRLNLLGLIRLSLIHI